MLPYAKRVRLQIRENLCKLQQQPVPYTDLSGIKRWLCFICIFIIQYKTSLWPTLTQDHVGKETKERYKSRLVKLTLNKSIMLSNTDHVFSEKNFSLFFQKHFMCDLKKRTLTLWGSCSLWLGRNYLKAL